MRSCLNDNLHVLVVHKKVWEMLSFTMKNVWLHFVIPYFGLSNF